MFILDTCWGLGAVFPDDHHPCSGNRPPYRIAVQKPMGLTPASRGGGLCCAGHRGRRTWGTRHADTVPRRGVHACDGGRSRLAATDSCADLVRTDSACPSSLTSASAGTDRSAGPTLDASGGFVYN